MVKSKLYLNPSLDWEALGIVVKIEQVRWNLDMARGRLHWWYLTRRNLPYEDPEIEKKIKRYENKIFDLNNQLIELKYELYTKFPFIEEVY